MQDKRHERTVKRVKVPKPWYPGHKNPRIRLATEMCMIEAKKRIAERKQPELTIGQYNSVYEAVEKIISVLQETNDGR